ncbi:MAG: DUF928 domain-containing protein [Waterburya sp.]
MNNFLSILILVNLIAIGFANQATAEGITTNSKKANSNYGLPTHRRDGGSRGSGNDCLSAADNRNLIALIPEQNIGINTSESPQLFFYVPEINKQKTIEFVVRNEQDELVYEAFISTKGQGIMSVAIPADINSNLLKKEQNYHWYFSLICNPQQRSWDIVLEGWLRQEAIDFASQQELNSATVIEQAEFYHQQGFWYDALAVLAKSQIEQPQIKAKWSELLQSVGLAEVATEPFISSELIKDSVISQ